MEQETIGQMVTNDMRRASVFRKYRIDFCCGGKKTLEQVCREKNIEMAAIQADLAEAEKGRGQVPERVSDWDLGFLADYIVNIHHGYIRRVVPDLLAWSEKVAQKHGERLAETIGVAKIFRQVVEELASHMHKEEYVLFPYLHALTAAEKNGKPLDAPGFGNVKDPILAMENEHELVGQLFMKMEQLTNNFTPPADACNTHRALYSTLKEFEDDLFLHIHLENNILFPKAVAAEQKLLNR